MTAPGGFGAGGLRCVAAIGAHCDDVVVGAGATLTKIAEYNPNVVIHVLVLTGGGTERESEVTNAFAALCPSVDIRLTVADVPHGEVWAHRRRARQVLATFRRSCAPDVVIGPQRLDHDPDRRTVAELVANDFTSHLVLGYELLKAQPDLPMPSLYLPISAETARRKTDVLARCYRPGSGRDRLDDEAFFSLMRVRGVQCNARYAEAFVVEKAIIDELGELDGLPDCAESYSVN